MYIIEAANNGWIVRPQISRHDCTIPTDINVFTDFNELAGWIRANIIPAASKVD